MRNHASTIERYILILCFYLRLIPYPCLCLILSLIRLDLLAMFKRRLNSLGFACKFQASLGFAWVRLQVSSVAWMRLHLLANFKRRLDSLGFACKFQASLGFAWIRLHSLAFACKFQVSFGFACVRLQVSSIAFSPRLLLHRKQPWRPSLTNKKTPCTPLIDVQGEWLQVPTARKPASVCQ